MAGYDFDCDDAGSSIHIRPSEKGSLHRALHVPEGQKIPASKLEAAKHSSNPAIRKKANFAENASHWHHDADPNNDAVSSGSEFVRNGPTQFTYGEMRPTPKR